MTRIAVKLECSQDTSSTSFSLTDLCITEKEWNEMTDDAKQRTITDAVHDMHDQPYWVLSSFSEK